MSYDYTPGLKLVGQLAFLEAAGLGSSEVEPVHWFLGFCKVVDSDPAAILIDATREELAAVSAEAETLKNAFRSATIDVVRVRRMLRSQLGGLRALAEPQSLSESSIRMLERTKRRVRRTGEVLGSPAVLTTLLTLPHRRRFEMVSALGDTSAVNRLLTVLGSQLGRDAKSDVVPIAEEAAARPSVLERYGRDLTRLAAEGVLPPLVGRRKEVKALARALLQSRKAGAVLVGDAGVGKTQIVEGLAQRIVGPKAPPALRNLRIIELSLASLLAGTKYRGEFEERLQAVLAAAADPRLVLFIDEIHMLSGAGGEGASDAANLMKPALGRRSLRLIGATTWQEYRRTIEKDPAFNRRLQVIPVDEPTADESFDILQGCRPRLEKHYGLRISDEALRAAVEMSLRFIHDRRLPDKAIDLIEQACTAVEMRTLSAATPASASPIPRTIGGNEISEIVANRYQTASTPGLTGDRAGHFAQAEKLLALRVYGQPEAVAAVGNALVTAGAGFNDPQRPIGCFLFLGGTGTGKTELAKATAEFLFGDESKLLRFDMSEYAEKHQAARLLGAPPGYVGYEDDGQLSGPMRADPRRVVLFDEVEKAHPEVMNLLLQVMDEGLLTDSQGRRASFREAVVIMTSNLGAPADEPDKGDFGFVNAGTAHPERSRRDLRDAIDTAVAAAFSPEFISRLEKAYFYPLDETAVRGILNKRLTQVCQRLRAQNIWWDVRPAAADYLLSHGFHPGRGAREMERLIDQLVVRPLAKARLDGRVRPDDRVIIDASPDGIDIRTETP